MRERGVGLPELYVSRIGLTIWKKSNKCPARRARSIDTRPSPSQSCSPTCGCVVSLDSPAGLGSLCDDFVRASLADPIPVQPDLERAEVNVFEGDRFGRHRKRLSRPVGLQSLELIRESNQILEDFADGLGKQEPAGRGDLLADFPKSIRTVLEGPFQAVFEDSSCMCPVPIRAQINLTHERLALDPVTVWKFNVIGTALNRCSCDEIRSWCVARSSGCRAWFPFARPEKEGWVGWLADAPHTMSVVQPRSGTLDLRWSHATPSCSAWSAETGCRLTRIK